MTISFLLKVIIAIFALALGYCLGSWWKKRFFINTIGEIKSYKDKLINEAQRETANIKREAHLQGQDLIFKMKNEFERELTEHRQEQKKLEDRLNQKEENFERRSETLAQREADAVRKELELVKKEKDNLSRTEEIEALIKEQQATLEKIAQMTSAEAKELLLKNTEEQTRHECGRLIRRIEAETREISDKKSKEILSLAVKRYASDYVAEHTISVVNLPNEEMKGRIIGREGRNIRAIEATTGVDLIIDDTPEAVILSSFSPIRREIARQSIEKLIIDGRIHPARIEEVVAKVSEEMEQSFKEIG
ncbi:MAG: Rnase Y domain-containing protein, partial [Deltaproteobacteria bacterium]|nr:Rnase Y domain-containing protein [Deltaproteobacteria bacterium]